MIDAQLINDLLHSPPLVKRYRVKAGDALRIQMPRLPLTKYTQFLKLKKTIEGDLDCFIEEPEPSQEGILLPGEVRGKAVCPGQIRIVLHAADRLTDEKIPGVEPLEIIVEIEAG